MSTPPVSVDPPPAVSTATVGRTLIRARGHSRELPLSLVLDRSFWYRPGHENTLERHTRCLERSRDAGGDLDVYLADRVLTALPCRRLCGCPRATSRSAVRPRTNRTPRGRQQGSRTGAFVAVDSASRRRRLTGARRKWSCRAPSVDEHSWQGSGWGCWASR
jgi:hypothetical protein